MIFAIILAEMATLAVLALGGFLYWLIFERFDWNYDDEVC